MTTLKIMDAISVAYVLYDTGHECRTFFNHRNEMTAGYGIMTDEGQWEYPLLVNNSGSISHIIPWEQVKPIVFRGS